MIFIPIFIAITALTIAYGDPKTPADPQVRMSEIQRGMLK